MARSRGVASVGAVAKEAGVSAMTVSRVFSNSPRVSEQTRRLVETAAKRLGYRPDPHISRLMGLVRGRRTKQLRAVLAVVRDETAEDALNQQAYHYMKIADIRRRATVHGYEVEEFWLGRGGLKVGRLEGILRARGIEGMLISPQSLHGLSESLDYSGFAAATFGYALAVPALHRASTNMMQGIARAVEVLERRGYQRVGLAVSEWIDARADHTYAGAMLHCQQKVPRTRRVPLMLFPHDDLALDRKVFCDWVRRHQPDAVISFHRPVARWLTEDMGLRIPQDIGLLAHDWMPELAAFAGIDHRRSHVAAAAVDLVAAQLQRNERGVPEVPRQILIPPLFVDGPSIRPPA